MNFRTSLIFLVLFSAGCGSGNGYEDYALKSSGELVLTAATHPHGYAKADCFHCHVQANIHQVDRLSSSQFPLARSLVERQGLASCRGCHGSNGAP